MGETADQVRLVSCAELIEHPHAAAGRQNVLPFAVPDNDLIKSFIATDNIKQIAVSVEA